MTESEGVIKYRLEHVPGPLPAEAPLEGLFRWFARCREHALIGRDPARYGGLAFGNISARTAGGFVISGTQTGGRDALTPADLAWVREFDPVANRLRASGPARPSSESMTHGQVYRAQPAVNAVIHVHSPAIWQAASHLQLPATPPDAAYGTPAMAAAVERLLNGPSARSTGLFVMQGHEDGVVAYAPDLDLAGALLLKTLENATEAPQAPAQRHDKPL